MAYEGFFPDLTRTLRTMDQMYAVSSFAKQAENIAAVARIGKQFEDMAALSLTQRAESIAAAARMGENVTAVSRLGEQLRVMDQITSAGRFAGVTKLLDDIGKAAAARTVVIPTAEVQALTQLTIKDVPDADALSEFDDELEDSSSVFDWLDGLAHERQRTILIHVGQALATVLAYLDAPHGTPPAAHTLLLAVTLFAIAQALSDIAGDD